MLSWRIFILSDRFSATERTCTSPSGISVGTYWDTADITSLVSLLLIFCVLSDIQIYKSLLQNLIILN